MAARTAVFAGTMGAVSHHQQQKYAEKDQAKYDQQMAEQQAMAAQQAPAAAPEEDKFAQLQKLAELEKQGVLTPEEFAAEKAKLLGT